MTFEKIFAIVALVAGVAFLSWLDSRRLESNRRQFISGKFVAEDFLSDDQIFGILEPFAARILCENLESDFGFGGLDGSGGIKEIFGGGSV